jgi:ABC-type antimicrobial peptide transport system permease subunit
VTVGLVAAQLAGGWLEDVLFPTPTSDPAAIAAAGSLLLLAAGIACAAPAWRAARVEPLDGLKDE